MELIKLDTRSAGIEISEQIKREAIAANELLHTGEGKGKAADCIGCGKCEAVCPQHLTIREYLKQVSAEFDEK